MCILYYFLHRKQEKFCVNSDDDDDDYRKNRSTCVLLLCCVYGWFYLRFFFFLLNIIVSYELIVCFGRVTPVNNRRKQNRHDADWRRYWNAVTQYTITARRFLLLLFVSYFWLAHLRITLELVAVRCCSSLLESREMRNWNQTAHTSNTHT